MKQVGDLWQKNSPYSYLQPNGEHDWDSTHGTTDLSVFVGLGLSFSGNLDFSWQGFEKKSL